AGVTVAESDPAEKIRKDVYFTGERAVHHELFAFIKQFGEIVTAHDGAIDTIHAGESGGIDEEAVDEICELVSSGAVYRPGLGEALIAGQNLFDHDVKGFLLCTLQASEIGSGIVKAVGVIDAKSVELVFVHELENKPVRGVKGRGVLHAERGQVINVEKTAVVDVVCGHAAVGEAVRLGFYQL